MSPTRRGTRNQATCRHVAEESGSDRFLCKFNSVIYTSVLNFLNKTPLNIEDLRGFNHHFQPITLSLGAPNLWRTTMGNGGSNCWKRGHITEM